MKISFILNKLNKKMYSKTLNKFNIIKELSSRYGYRNKKYDKSLLKNELFEFFLFSSKINSLLLKADFYNLNLKIKNIIKPFIFKKFIHNVLNFPYLLNKNIYVYLFDLPKNCFLFNNKIILELTSITNLIKADFFKLNFNNIKNINKLEKVDHIIVHTKYMKKDLINYLFCNEDKIKILPRAISNDFFINHSNSKVNLIKEKYKIPQNYFLFAGKITRYKNLERLICAFLELKIKNTYLLIAGDYNKDYESYFHAFSYFKVIQNLSKINKNIKLLGYVNNNDMPILMSSAIATIEPSFYNNFPDTIVESYARSTPVIASNINVHKDFIKDEELLFSPYSVNEIKECILKVINKKNTNYDFVKKYSPDNVYEEYKNYLNSL